jgi:hypothetical protein
MINKNYHNIPQVIRDKKAVFNKNLKDGKLPSPSLAEIIKDDKAIDRAVQRAKSQANKVLGLRDDLDDIDENDVGEKRRLAFLDLMIETAYYSKEFTDEQIKDQVDTIMFEGKNRNDQEKKTIEYDRDFFVLYLKDTTQLRLVQVSLCVCWESTKIFKKKL